MDERIQQNRTVRCRWVCCFSLERRPRLMYMTWEKVGVVVPTYLKRFMTSRTALGDLLFFMDKIWCLVGFFLVCVPLDECLSRSPAFYRDISSPSREGQDIKSHEVVYNESFEPNRHRRRNIPPTPLPDICPIEILMQVIYTHNASLDMTCVG